jgi:hypothetical protein
MALANFTDDILSVGQGLASKFVQKVTVTSALLPDITIDDPLGATTPTATSPDIAPSFDFLALLKPKITIYTSQGPHTVAPWGDPGENTYWPLIVSSLALGSVLELYGTYKLFRGGK